MDSDKIVVCTYKPFMLMMSKSTYEHKRISSSQHLMTKW